MVTWWFRTILLILLGLVAAGLVALAYFRPKTGERPTVAAAARLTDSSCRRCHRRTWHEWEESAHRRAWTDPSVQAAFQHFGFDRKCQSCHAPQPVLVAGVDKEVQLRERNVEGGVTCLSCHGLPGGRRVAARRTMVDAPCRPVATAELSTSRFCGGCHGAIYEDWQTSRYADRPTACRDCHMPSEPEGGSSHLCRGGHDPATVRSGAVMACRREANELVVTVTNQGCGHNFPGERHNRVLLLQVIERSPQGRIALSRQQLIKGITPFRGESSADQIRAGETFEARFPVAEVPVTAEVKLLYKLFPWYTDRAALVVQQARVPLESLTEGVPEREDSQDPAK